MAGLPSRDRDAVSISASSGDGQDVRRTKRNATTDQPTHADIRSLLVRRTSCPSRACRTRPQPAERRPADVHPQSRRRVELRFQPRRTRCPSYKQNAARPADLRRHPFSPCTTDILSVARLEHAIELTIAFATPSIDHRTQFEQPRRTRRARRLKDDIHRFIL